MPGHTREQNDSRAVMVTDDWPDSLPITEEELDLFEAHFLDIVTAMIQHG